jgi:zinc transport system substrate-binding protein
MIHPCCQNSTFAGEQSEGINLDITMKPFVCILWVILVFGGCSFKKGNTTGNHKILVTILPEKTFIEKIAGNDFDITVLVPPGANPSVYSLLPSQMVDITRASLWFRMGYVGFELSSGDRIKEVNTEMKIVDLSTELDIISQRSMQNPAIPVGHDPHTWMSPENVKAMATQIKKELVLINPSKEKEYKLAFQLFLDEIRATHDSINNILKDKKGKKFITYHPSLTYFARDYGLIQLSLEEGGKEPSPSHLTTLIETAKQEGIKTIYIQSEYDKELATTFADEIGGKIVQIRPLNPAWSENLINIARALKENP